MLYYKNSKQMDLSDRIAIETGIYRGESFKQIAKRLNRHPSTIAHEIKENRTFIHGTYPCGKDCKYVRTCREKNLCGCDEAACRFPCRTCRGVDCRTICKRYVSIACHKFERPPYVCNTCPDHKKRDKCGVAIAPQLVRMTDEICERYGIRSRNDFVEQAMRFYIDALVNGEESVWAYLNLYSRYETENKKYQPIER